MTSKSYHDNYFAGLVLLDSLLYSLTILFSRGYCMIFGKKKKSSVIESNSICSMKHSIWYFMLCVFMHMCVCLHIK